jgi:glc operon protein GlcG
MFLSSSAGVGCGKFRSLQFPSDSTYAETSMANLIFSLATRRAIARALCGLLLAIGCAAAIKPGAAQQPSPSLVTTGHSKLNLAGAELILRECRAKAEAMQLKVNIAVVDDGGHPIAFARMDGARPGSSYTAQTKAVAAATFRGPTGPVPAGAAAPDLLLNFSLQNAAAASGGKMTSLLGGVPVVIDSTVVAAVGVGGATGEQDAQIARAGIDAFLKAIGKQ